MAFIRCGMGGGSAEPVEVWSNPTPNANFSAQTLNIDLSSYDGILLFLKRQTVNPNNVAYDDNHAMLYIPMGTSAYRITVCNQTNYRSITVGATGVTLSASTGAQSYVIPIKIWGIKTGTLT